MNPRILLVEDDPTSRAFLQAATESLPAQVDAAASMAEALALAGAHAHALWLIDANLPDGSGSELLARLRAGGASTPALAHTASRERAEHQALLAAGFLATLAKPLPAGEWLAAIRRALAGPDRGGAEPLESGAHRIGQPPADYDLAVWDDAQALSALAGDAGNVAAMRRLFLAELPGARDSIVAAAAAGDLEALRAALHRLEAGCGFVGAARLGAAVARLRASPGAGEVLQGFESAAQDTLPGA
ncbi:response regulator [uncultured Luteimonas sp.]|uniref:Hpt domain-containing response regulator n=1 Tax=uncultured Luteimonas sp. TaxID=453144 RepID=UPI002612E7E4|nr:response regulator [uncultured Luteimonas sp.]